MSKSLVKNIKNNKGFTVGEVLITVCIIALLVAMMIISLIDAGNKYEDASTFGSFKAMASPAFMCLTSGVAGVFLTDPAGNIERPICSYAAAANDSIWPDQKYGWSNILWCNPSYDKSVLPVTCTTYKNGNCGGDNATGNFCILAVKGSGVDQKSIWCTVTGCHKIGF